MQSPNPNTETERNDDDGEEEEEEEDDYCFIDSVDDFSFDDCSASLADRSDQSTSGSALSDPSQQLSSSPAAATLRRRSISRRGVPGDSNRDSSASIVGIAQGNGEESGFREKRQELYSDSKERERILGSTESSRASPDSERDDSVRDVSGVGKNENGEEEEEEEEEEEKSTVTSAVNDERVGDSVDSVIEGDSSLLVYIAALVIKAIGFQFSLVIKFITFPFWVLYCSYMVVIDPFGAIRRGRGFLAQKLGSLWNLVAGFLSALTSDWLKEHETIWKILLQFGWGLLWCSYVFIVLCGLLVFSIMASGLFMRFLVEEPLQVREELNFDFTKNSPVAFVPITSCDGVPCSLNCKEKGGGVKSTGQRVIPLNHKIQVAIFLTLPESEYNRNLGMFQVRVDFLSADGKILASKRHPCMLKYKSKPIQVFLTFLKIAPLVAGFMSESQNVELKIRGFTETYVPTSCLKVTIEQRAEYRPGAGIPELYDAFLALKSELPFFRRIIWHWKKTMFIWITIVVFMMELLLALICCRPIIIPKARPRNDSTFDNSAPRVVPEQS